MEPFATPDEPSQREAVPYANALAGGHSATWRLATLVVGALGFTFLGGCFCIGVLYLAAITGAYPGGNTPEWARTRAVLGYVLFTMAGVCFVTALALILSALRFDRATR